MFCVFSYFCHGIIFLFNFFNSEVVAWRTCSQSNIGTKAAHSLSSCSMMKTSCIGLLSRAESRDLLNSSGCRTPALREDIKDVTWHTPPLISANCQEQTVTSANWRVAVKYPPQADILWLIREISWVCERMADLISGCRVSCQYGAIAVLKTSSSLPQFVVVPNHLTILLRTFIVDQVCTLDVFLSND